MAAAVAVAVETNKTLQRNTETIVANKALVIITTETAAHIHKALQDNRSALVQKLKAKLTPEQAKALQAQLVPK